MMKPIVPTTAHAPRPTPHAFPLQERRVDPEWLDELPPDDPQAIGSRRDLRRLNWMMDHAGILARLLAESPTAPRKLVELGAGDGTFSLRVARRLAPRWREVRVTLVDRQALLSAGTRDSFRRLGWTVEAVEADVFDWLREARPGAAEVIVANLFLHHFTAEKLANLLALAAGRARLFAACEPRRGGLALAAARLLGLIGCNAVTRHDAVVSVRAGFAGRELSALWPGGDGWQTTERRAGLFSHAFSATRDGA